MLLTILGLPLHALVVHFAVVLVPGAATALIVVGSRKEWRERYLWPVALLAVIGAIAAILTASSGESLQETVEQSARAAGTRADFGSHPGEGNVAEDLAVLVAMAACGFFALQRWGQRFSVPAWGPAAAYAVSSVIALAAIIAMVVAGHSGATLVWKDLGNFVSKS